MINEIEMIELRYLYTKSYKYLAKNEYGTINVFKCKPHKNIELNISIIRL